MVKLFGFEFGKKAAPAPLSELDMLRKEIARLEEQNKQLVKESVENQDETLELGLKAHEEQKLTIELTEKLGNVADSYVNNSEALNLSQKELTQAKEAYAAQKAANELSMKSARLSALEKVALANSARLAGMSVAEYQEFKASQVVVPVAEEEEAVVPEVTSQISLSYVKVNSLADAKTAKAILTKGEDLILDVSELEDNLGARIVQKLWSEAKAYQGLHNTEANKYVFSMSEERMRAISDSLV